MAKLSLSDVTAGYSAAARINSNSVLIEEAVENTLSRDGRAPNTMAASIDMNSNSLINLAAPTAANDAARWIDVTDAVELTGQVVPSLTGNADKFLSTDGTTLSWLDPLFYPRTSAEIAAGVTPTTYKYEPGNVKRYGAVGDGAANDTTPFVNAAATGHNVLVPAGSYLVNGGAVTLNTVGQKMSGDGPGNTLVKKRSNGNLITISNDYIVLEHIGIHNDDAATFTGYNIYSTGDHSGVKLLNVNAFRSVSSCVRFEGGSSNAGHWTIRSGTYNNAPAAAGTPVIHFGTTVGAGAWAMLYGQISDVQVQPSGNPIRLDGCGGVHISDSQIGGVDINSTGGFNNINSVVGCRITGPISIEGSSHHFTANAVGAHAITFEALSSGCTWIGNSRDTGSSMTNSGNVSNIILDIDAGGIPHFLENFRMNNNKFIRCYNNAGTSYGQIGMTSGDNFSVGNNTGSTQIHASGTNPVQLISNGAESVRADANAVAGNTRLMIYDVDNATLERVSVGAADSGGAGFKLLRIPN